MRKPTNEETHMQPIAEHIHERRGAPAEHSSTLRAIAQELQSEVDTTLYDEGYEDERGQMLANIQTLGELADGLEKLGY